jgi:hypothetical protein
MPMDSSQYPSLNDQRCISTMEPPTGVDVKIELGAPPPEAAPQPAPVNPTTLAPSAKSFELMRQLEVLAHEITVVSRRDSSDQCIKVQEGPNFSAGPQTVEPSIRVSPHDQLASFAPSFGRRTSLTLANFFIAARDRLASFTPSFGRRTSHTLANFFIAARNRLASFTPSFGRRTSHTLANFFMAARNRLASFTPSFGRRTSLTLPNFFIAARDRLASFTPSFGRQTFPTLASFFIAALIGVATAFVWQTQLVSTAKSPNDVAVAEKQSDFTPVGQLSLQDAPPQIAPATQTAPASTAPATSSELVQQFEGMARDLVVLQRRVEELAAKQEHLVDAQEQLAARQEQMAQNIAKPQTVKLPSPRPPLSVPPDRR